MAAGNSGKLAIMDTTVAKRQHERKMSMSLRIQTSYRCRCARASAALVFIASAGATCKCMALPCERLIRCCAQVGASGSMA